MTEKHTEPQIAKIKEFNKFLQSIKEERREHIMKAKAAIEIFEKPENPKSTEIVSMMTLLLDEVDTLWEFIIPINEALFTYFEEIFMMQKVITDAYSAQSKSSDVEKLGSEILSITQKFEKIEPLLEHIENAIKKHPITSPPKEMYG